MNHAERERERERRKTRKALIRAKEQAKIDIIAAKQMLDAQRMEMEAEREARWLADLEHFHHQLTGARAQTQQSAQIRRRSLDN